MKTDTDIRKYIGRCIALIEFVKRFDLELPIIIKFDGYSVTLDKILKEIEE